jgi:hypothetical protein
MQPQKCPPACFSILGCSTVTHPKPDRISVAKLRLGDFHKEERQRAASTAAVARGKVTFGEAVQAYRERFKGDRSLKERSKVYREERFRRRVKILA